MTESLKARPISPAESGWGRLTAVWRRLNTKRWHVVRQTSSQADQLVRAYRWQVTAETRAHRLQSRHHELGVFYAAYRAELAARRQTDAE